MEEALHAKYVYFIELTILKKIAKKGGLNINE